MVGLSWVLLVGTLMSCVLGIIVLPFAGMIMLVLGISLVSGASIVMKRKLYPTYPYLDNR